jgi:aminoglycoside phosphotransferase
VAYADSEINKKVSGKSVYGYVVYVVEMQSLGITKRHKPLQIAELDTIYNCATEVQMDRGILG